MEKPLSQNIQAGREPLSLSEYRKVGGYGAVDKALKQMAPEDVTEIVKKSSLKGRGGAGFPTGDKWSYVPMGQDAPHPKYLIANADEMEPGTFKDRFLLEGDPHQLIEGIIVSAYAIQAEVAYIFLRWAYKRAAGLIERALREAYEAGYLGKNILGSGFNLELYLHTSAGRYICGEETSLLNALEGKRAIPRTKPPFPQTCGLFGKPTVVNNVETLSCIPHIVKNGAEWFISLSRTQEGGTKIYGVSGKVKRPGVWELPLGTTLREILEEHAGGMMENVKFRGLLPGGASTDFQVEQHLDEQLDFSHVMRSGSRLGTGNIIILDDKICPVGFVHNLESFFARESCGWCTPCREGIPWIVKTLQALEEGQGRPEDLKILDSLAQNLSPGHTFCPLAPGAVEPLQSALNYFREDFERHIKEKRCPWK
jgi:NADH-quinone oxidoreductase subunit F